MKKHWKIAALGCALISGLAVPSFGQRLNTPPEITPPPGNILFLAAHGTGTQNYICEPSTAGKGAWVFYSPQATLLVPIGDRFERQTATHFLSPAPNPMDSVPSGCSQSGQSGDVSCPTWQSSLDRSAVWGGKLGSITAGSDASCPNSGAIPCLLLSAVATRRDPLVPDLLAETTFVQRLDTQGGSAPATACTVGEQVQVPYSADYLFYKSEKDDHDRGR